MLGRKAGRVQAKGSLRQSHRLPAQPSSSKPQVLGAHRLVKGFSLGQLLGKEANPHPKYLVFLGEDTCGAVHREPAPWIATAVWCFHTNVRFERKVKGASALYCVYILKKQKFCMFLLL